MGVGWAQAAHGVVTHPREQESRVNFLERGDNAGMYIHANVSGCPPRHDVLDKSLDEHCYKEKDGKVRIEGIECSIFGAQHILEGSCEALLYRICPFSALMKTDRPAHAACILELPGGTLLLVWFSGAEGSAGVGIVGSRLEAGGPRFCESYVSLFLHVLPANIPVWPCGYYTVTVDIRLGISTGGMIVQARDSGASRSTCHS
eukprot:193255-Pyramimonas_sp.AAC.1